MKKLSLFLLLLLVSCLHMRPSSEEELFLCVRKENWGQWHAGDTTSLHFVAEVFTRGEDTIYYTTNYYPNGVVKCKARHIKDHLDKVYFVNDTLGNLLDYGSVENGNGYVKKYNFQGNLEYSGAYLKGNKEGWWKFYHYSGEVLDSMLYKKGVDVTERDVEVFGPWKLKDNWYN